GGDDVTGSLDNNAGSTDVVTTDTTIENPSIGSGVGSAYQDGILTIANMSLSAGGSTQISATIVDPANGYKKIVSESYTVVFSSACASDGRAEFGKDGAVTTSSGDVSVSYTALGCSGEDVISFRMYNKGQDGSDSQDQALAVATGTVNIAPPTVGAIVFDSVDNPFISIATIGDAVLPKIAVVKFKVIDTANNPISNQEVDFELTNTTGGTSLSISQSVTNDLGEVSTFVLAGTTNAVTSVKASTLATDGVTRIYTSSQSISVTTGIVDQDSFSISLSKYSTLGWDVSGDQSVVLVSAYAADHYQNPVADGTVINFVADAGSLPSSCQTINGACTIEWRSQSPLPGSDHSGVVRLADSSRPHDANVVVDPTWNGGLPGVATIMAYTSGEAGFADANGNNLFDAGEQFFSYAEAFLDANENGIYDFDANLNPKEELFDYNN
ncbi:MAG: hypothetical protein VW258_08845, partial [Thalassolituus sp.]